MCLYQPWDGKVHRVQFFTNDNKFLECAVTVRADYIISRDIHILKIKEFEGIKIVSPELFVRESWHL